MSLTLLYALLFSLVLHVALVLFGPTIRPPLVDESPVASMEVDLVRREIVLPEALRPKPLPPVPLPQPLDLKRLLDERGGAAPAPRLTARVPLSGKARLPESQPLPGPPELNLPRLARASGAPGPSVADRPALKPGALALPAPPEDAPKPARRLSRSRTSPPPRRERAILDRELARLAGIEAEPRPKAPAIRGPAARRRIIFRPPPPKMKSLEKSEDIILRFWVLPDGTVGRVVPVRKGSARLEGVATNHLKRWRFSPIPPDAPRREEWGIVAFRFRVR